MRYDIRNSNLINFDGVRKMSEGFERKQLEIKIVYYKSSSKYYDSVCLQCEGMNGYNQEKSTNTLCLALDELKENQNKTENPGTQYPLYGEASAPVFLAFL